MMNGTTKISRRRSVMIIAETIVEEVNITSVVVFVGIGNIVVDNNDGSCNV